MRVKNVRSVLRDHRRNQEEEMLRGYEEKEDKARVSGLRFQKRVYCWEAVMEDISWLVELDVDLVQELEKLYHLQEEMRQKLERGSRGA